MNFIKKTLLIFCIISTVKILGMQPLRNQAKGKNWGAQKVSELAKLRIRGLVAPSLEKEVNCLIKRFTRQERSEYEGNNNFSLEKNNLQQAYLQFCNQNNLWLEQPSNIVFLDTFHSCKKTNRQVGEELWDGKFFIVGTVPIDVSKAQQKKFARCYRKQRFNLLKRHQN